MHYVLPYVASVSAKRKIMYSTKIIVMIDKVARTLVFITYSSTANSNTR